MVVEEEPSYKSARAKMQAIVAEQKATPEVVGHANKHNWAGP